MPSQFIGVNISTGINQTSEASRTSGTYVINLTEPAPTGGLKVSFVTGGEQRLTKIIILKQEVD